MWVIWLLGGMRWRYRVSGGLDLEPSRSMGREGCAIARVTHQLKQLLTYGGVWVGGVGRGGVGYVSPPSRMRSLSPTSTAPRFQASRT